MKSAAADEAGHISDGGGPDPGQSAKVLKRSMVIAGHRTSISLEDIFWTTLKAMAAKRGQSIASLVARIDEGRGSANLSSAIRVFVLTEALRAPRREHAVPAASGSQVSAAD